MSNVVDSLEKFKKDNKNRVLGRSKLWQYKDIIKDLLENDYPIVLVYEYLRDYHQIKYSKKYIYNFIQRNKDKILNSQTEPAKEEPKQQPTAPEPKPQPVKEETKPKPKEPERKPERKQIKSEEENPLTYEEYSRDYDKAEEVKGEDIYKHGFVFTKSTWEKITKEEFAEVVKYLQTHHIQFTKKEYYTSRKLKQKCLDENIDLRFYLMYIENIKDIDIKAKRGLNDRKVVSTLENFSKGFMVEKR